MTMPYIPVPKDLTKVKSKVLFNLTKRQLVCLDVYKRQPYGRYGNIFLSQTEYDELQAEYPDRLERFIEEMSRYLAANGKSYQNYAAALRIWAGNDKKKAPDIDKIHSVFYCGINSINLIDKEKGLSAMENPFSLSIKF